MSALFFDQFSDEPVLIKPYESIGDDVVLAYDRDALKNGTMSSVRQIVDAVGQPFLAIDGLNFADQWFGLEINLGNNFRAAKVTLKTYPARQIYPKVYFDGGFLDMSTLEVGEEVTEVNFTARHMAQAGLIDGAQDLRLSLMVPSCDWFAIGLYGVKIIHA
tara:strand:- start:44399 stop:44881 length:483 start_codon:yes stop_codon:yes gene_type:complete